MQHTFCPGCANFFANNLNGTYVSQNEIFCFQLLGLDVHCLKKNRQIGYSIQQD